MDRTFDIPCLLPDSVTTTGYAGRFVGTYLSACRPSCDQGGQMRRSPVKYKDIKGVTAVTPTYLHSAFLAEGLCVFDGLIIPGRWGESKPRRTRALLQPVSCRRPMKRMATRSIDRVYPRRVPVAHGGDKKANSNDFGLYFPIRACSALMVFPADIPRKVQKVREAEALALGGG